jgi:nickel-dependent lactate racemase
MLKELIQTASPISDVQLDEVVCAALAGEDIVDRRVLFIVPDSTRSMPMHAMTRALCHATEQASTCDFLIALGTHPAMSPDAIDAWLGVSDDARQSWFRGEVFNHEWQNKEALVEIGSLSESEIADLSEGLLNESVSVAINKRVFDYDLVCVVGPVFPHEVVGFSGGNKYFFPGVAGPEILHLFHWLGALITNPVINGAKTTAVRAVINASADMVNVEKRAFCLNVNEGDCNGIFYGSPEEAWSAAADMAAKTHIRYLDKPYKTVLALCPTRYDDLWVAGKCMYKLENAVADGGELIIYAPHVSEISVTHGEILRRIGYHTRDYFLAQMDKFDDVPGGIIAHSTHVRGIGTYEDGVEKCRVDVTLATSIPEAESRAINLGYRDYKSIDADEWRDREDEGILVVDHAGEVLYQLRSGNPAPGPVAAPTG